MHLVPQKIRFTCRLLLTVKFKGCGLKIQTTKAPVWARRAQFTMKLPTVTQEATSLLVMMLWTGTSLSQYETVI